MGRYTVANGGKRLEDLKVAGWMPISPHCAKPAELDNSRGALRQDDLDFSIIQHRTRYLRQDRHAHDISAFLRVPVGRVLERRVPAQCEAVVPAPHKRITWFHLENTVMGGSGVAGDGR